MERGSEGVLAAMALYALGLDLAMIVRPVTTECTVLQVKAIPDTDPAGPAPLNLTLNPQPSSLNPEWMCRFLRRLSGT